MGAKKSKVDDVSSTLPRVAIQQRIPPMTRDSHIEREADQLTEIEKERMQSMIETHIQEQGALNVKVVKGMLYGPPRVGKTSLKKHLIDEELTDISPSTGIDRPQTVPIFHDTEVTTTLVASDVRKSHEKEWKPLEIKETLETCLNFLTETIPSPTVCTSDQLNETKSLEDDIISESTTTSNTVMNPQSQSSSDPIEVPPPIIDLIKAGDWSKVNKELKGIEDVTLFQMIDVGGQPEFHDILPLLLTGPALYLLFIRLDQELDKTYTYQYQHEDGSNSTSYTSQLTVFQVLHQILSTIDSSSDDSALIIGTHHDKVIEEKYKEVDSHLKMKMEGVAYYERIKYVLDDKLVFPINNLSDTVKDEIIPLRKRIKRVLSKFKGESLPTAYALFYYLLQNQPTKKILTLNEARDLAKDLKIDNIVEDVLKFIHNKFGSVLYYNDVEGEKLVFCDPNVILQAVNKLVAVCFGANPDDRTIANNLRKTGTITPENFVKLCQFFDDNSRLRNYVISLLKARHILSAITVESNEKYFLPCLLDVCQDTQPVPESQEEVAPLLIKICQKDTKYTTIPPGLFPSIIVMLSNPSRPSTIGTWTLVDEINEKRFKNKVSFFFGDQELVQVDLIAQPQWIEIRMKQMSPVTAPCMIREDVIAAIEDIKRSQTLLGQILSACKREFGFYCYELEPFCFAKHMPENKTKLRCTGCQDRLHGIEDNQLIWFEDPSSSTSQTATNGGAQPVTPQLTDEPEMSDLARQLHQIPPVDDIFPPTLPPVTVRQQIPPVDDVSSLIIQPGIQVSSNSNGCDDTSDDTEPNQPSVIDPPLSTSQTTTTNEAHDQPVTPQLTDEPKMSDLARLLHPVKPHWKAFGVQLDIPGYELDSIGRDPTLDDLDKLTKVCQHWKDKKTTEVSWRKILDVIRNHPTIHNKDVCQQIEKFLGIEPVQMSSSMETNQPTGTAEIQLPHHRHHHHHNHQSLQIKGLLKWAGACGVSIAFFSLLLAGVACGMGIGIGHTNETDIGTSCGVGGTLGGALGAVVGVLLVVVLYWYYQKRNNSS